MSDTEKELKNIESMMFGGFIEPTPKNGIAWRVFEAVMGLRKERDQWRECAERLAERLNWWAGPPQQIGGHQESIVALREFERLKGEAK
jgi:hypothetical protein